MDKKSLLELAEKYISIGLVNWEMPNASRKKEVQVYINLLELKAFCIPDKDEKEMLEEIKEMLKSQKTETDEKPIKGNNPQAGYFIRAGTVGIHEYAKNDSKRRKPIGEKSINFYINMPKLNKNGLAECEEKMAERLSRIIIWQYDKDTGLSLKRESENASK